MATYGFNVTVELAYIDGLSPAHGYFMWVNAIEANMLAEIESIEIIPRCDPVEDQILYNVYVPGFETQVLSGDYVLHVEFTE